ncbi:hypothetical protein [Accumulibacter sp.]|uniref:hypothetical protein n=1 Tax=Accumulibacter sp. TaxID=2053492 RepID=UPI002BECEE27|nr:hypothetical protein [Accumulibacter sp.]HRF06976.1 hypothetical protein [Accumulibacter sp.]
MSPDDLWRIRHMIDAAEQALAFVQRRERADLDSDPMLLLALTQRWGFSKLLCGRLSRVTSRRNRVLAGLSK